MSGREAGLVPGQRATTAPNTLGGVARGIGEVELLLVVLTALYYFVAQGAIGSSLRWFLTLLVFGAGVAGLRFLRSLEQRQRLRLALEAVAMVLFITGLISQVGRPDGPLNHLYLLPVVASALLLGRGFTALLVGLILASRVTLGMTLEGPSWFSLRQLIPLFAELSPTLLIAFLTSALASELNRATQTIRSLAEQDDLTGLLNLRSFTRLATAEQTRAAASGQSSALLLVDIEQLREINHQFGHEAGDRALLAVAAGLRRATRTGDLCARYGGDEFVVLLPFCGRGSAEAVANRIRHDVFSATQDFDYAMRRITVNTGIAVAPEDAGDLRSLIREADRALRLDKQARRRREPGSLPAREVSR